MSRMACECCREGAVHYSTASVHQYTPLGNQPPSHMSQMSERPACCHHHNSPHVHTHHGSVHHSQHHHSMACSVGHCSHQQRHGDAATTEDCCRCGGHSHHTHRHMPPIASPLSITHTPNLPYSPPMFHTPQAVYRSHERCRCQQFLTPQHHQMRLNCGANPRRQLLGTPVQHHYHKQHPQQHSQAVGHQSYHFSENANYDVNASHTHSNNHIGLQHQPASPISGYAQPLPPSPQTSELCGNQIGHGETFHLGFSPPCSNAPMPTLPRSHFQLAPNVLEYEDHCVERNGSKSNSQQEQPLYSGLVSSHTNSTPQLPSHHNQPSQLEHSHPHSNPQPEHSHPHSNPRPEHSHPHSNPRPEHSHPHSNPRPEHSHPHSMPAVSRPASIPLPRPEVVIERLPLSITKREKILTSSVDGSKSEAPSQADTSGNQSLLNEDPLGGLKKEKGGKQSDQPEQPGLTDQPEQPGLTDQPEPVVPKTENRSPHEKWYLAATSTDTESDPMSDGRKRSLRSFKQRQASKEGGAVKLLSPRRTRRRAVPIVIDTTDTESEAEVEPPKALRNVYPLRSKKEVVLNTAELELVSSMGQRVGCSTRFQTRQKGADSEEQDKERDSLTDSDSGPSPRRRLHKAGSTGRLAILEDEEDSAEVKVEEEVRISLAEQQVDSDQQLQTVALKEEPSSLESEGGGDESEPVGVEPDSVLSQPVDGAEEEPKEDDRENGKQPVVLEGWYFRVVADGLVILEGTKENDGSGMKWHSGPVERRQSARDLVTRSGATYHLSGELNRELLSKAGGVDSKDIARRFRNGFPKDWATLLQRHFEEQQKVEPEEEDYGPVVDQRNEESEKKVTVKSEQDELKTPVLDCSLATSDFLSSLKRSSRGRTLKPSTYSTWCMSPFLNLSSSLYSYDMCGSFEGISSPVIDLTGEGSFMIEPKKPKKKVKTEKVFGTIGSEVEDEVRMTENEDSLRKLRLDVKKTKEENTTPDTGQKLGKDTGRNQKAEVLHTSTVTSVKTHSKHRRKRVIPSALLKKKVKKILSDVELESTSYSSASQTQEKVVTVKQTTTKRSVRIMRKSKEQSNSRSGAEHFPEGRAEDEQTDTETESNSESQRGGRGRPRRGVGSRGVAFSRVIADNTESDNSSVERVQKRGRGRPRTQQQDVRTSEWASGSRGVTFSQVNSESDNSSVERVQKRGRGRPRTQKRGIERASALASGCRGVAFSQVNTESDNSSVERVQKRGRGRPRTQQQDVVRTSEWASGSRGVTFSQVNSESDNSSVERVQKRGRGRPRTQKQGIERASALASGCRGVAFSQVNTESDNSSVERVQKRGRGRPRTQQQRSERALGSRGVVFSQVNTESDNSSVERVQKRGRGRPRTQQQHVERASEQASMKKVEPRMRISKEAAISGDPQEEWTLSGDLREDEELKWTTEDFRSLKSIVHAVPAMTSNFWEVVARRLGTGHSARECSRQYLQATARGPKRRPERAQERPGAAVAAAPVITGKTGTMKRKRQIRSALEHMDQGYSDDIFDSTPFKKKMKRVELQELSDDECFHDNETSEESRPIRTPSEAKRRLGAPTSHTPKLSDYLTTPDLKSGMRREAADNVMYKIQKAKKGPKKPPKKSATAAVPKSKSAAQEPLLRNIRTGEVTAIRMFEDSDDDSEESSPFSDIEDTYRDIITRLH